MVLFVLCAIIFVLRVRAARIELPSRLKWFAFGMGIVTVCIFIRCVYRTIELLQGWSGWIITHEVFFICLELVPMGVCVWAFNLFHPGIYLAEIEKPVAVQAEATQSTGVQKVPASPEDSAVEIVTM